MQDLTISAVARQVGLRPSAIRYYERIGLMPPAFRIQGRRRYDAAAVKRLLVIGRARAAGFSLAEIRRLFTGFPEDASPAERWRALSRDRLAQLQDMMHRLQGMQRLLLHACRCRSLEECGDRLLAFECGDAAPAAVPPPLAASLLNLRRTDRPH
jgi:MerR family redox-sensitive transcriptional activator SoxR